ncbi:MAG: sugar ABC transporter permease [Lachnospiraceae bacterium]|nr:sugar ABC transporter permease [Lachnospiraceae bacterium]MBR3598741.1 sugar ABC transporter permease [Lachnospiraceae bacterium]
MNKLKKFGKKNIGFIFIIPWLIGFLVFKLYPFMSSLYYSFTDYNLFAGMTEGFTLQNYKDVFTVPVELTALKTTFKYAFMTVPMKLVFALFIAYILNFKLKGVNLFRTIYYVPSILGGSVAIAVLWKALFNDNGLIRSGFALIGIDAPHFMSDPKWALLMISILRVWQFGSAMVVFLAALKGVSQDLYEAAAIDGASKTRQFFSITLPLITPVVFYNLVTQLVQAFQEFNGPYIITRGGPLGSTTLMSLLVYNNAFTGYDMGKASAQAWVLFVILMIFTMISFWSQKHWVYYADDEN